MASLKSLVSIDPDHATAGAVVDDPGRGFFIFYYFPGELSDSRDMMLL